MLSYRARFYDPQLGRFITEDPIRFVGDDENWYTYVNGNPISDTDPSGFKRKKRYRIPRRKDPLIPVPNQKLKPTANNKTYCCTKTWTECYAQRVENNRLDSLIPAALSALPKRMLPPFRVVQSEQRLTTVSSVIAHYLPESMEGAATALRGAGRLASTVGTPLLVFEGFYDWGVLGSCAELCHRNPCN